MFKKAKKYISLTKPGIIRGNLLAAAAGFFFGAHGEIDLRLALFTLLGMSLIIGGSCVLNNIIDVDIDAKMERTKKRVLVSGLVSKSSALIYGTILLLLGIAVLYLWVGSKTLLVGLFGSLMYVLVYGYFKRKTDYGTLIGSISGSTPPLAGYVAVTGKFDATALLLFLLLTAWQMPHFYAIAIYRKSEYMKAKLPLLSITRGVETTKKHIIFFQFVFLLVCVMIFFVSDASFTFLLTMSIMAAAWIFDTLKNYQKSDIVFGKRVFGYSLLCLLVACLVLSFDWILP